MDTTMDTTMENKLKDLAVRLLDTDEGIANDAYYALLELLPENDQISLAAAVKCTEGRYYLPSNALQDWRI